MSLRRENKPLVRLILSAMFLAMAMVLPFLTGQIPQIGSALSPMHLPVFFCGFVCGSWYGAAVGFIAPLLRYAMFHTPPIMPTGIAMCFELFTYGLVAGYLYRLLPQKKWRVYPALVASMLIGRAVWGLARLALYGLGKSQFGWTAFMTGAFTGAIPGIILHIVLVPLVILALEKAFPRLMK